MNESTSPQDEPKSPPEIQQPPNSVPSADRQAPAVATEVDKEQIARFVTTIKNAEQQVGEHIIRALQYDNTVAVLTTVVVGADGQQRVVSAALTPERMAEVNRILQDAQQDRVEEEPCIGFHCLVKPKPAVN